METGWVPEHMVIKRQNELVGVIPNYRKFNSNGEYVFDHIFVTIQSTWLKIFSKISLKAFHSCQKKNFFYSSKKIELNTLSELIIDFLLQKKIPSFHINFIEKKISDKLRESGFSQRLGIQYYWYNNFYKTFDCFLSSLKRKKRKNIIKEREFLKKQKISFFIKESSEITLEDIDYFYQCYSNTIKKKWAFIT